MSISSRGVTRVLHVVEAAGGGVLSVIADAIRVLHSAFPGRFEFTIAYSGRGETPADLESSIEAKFVRMDLGRRLFSFEDLGSARILAALSRSFDAVHLHSSRAGFIGRLSRLFGGCVRVFYSPHCYAFHSEEFSSTKRVAIFLTECLLARVPGTTTIACGDSEFMSATRVGGPRVLVRNGYAAEVPAAPSVGDRARQLVVGSGRNALQKDPECFLEIARALGDVSAEFLWVGDLSGHPLSTGWLPRREATLTLQGADIFLMTSRWEGLPVAGLEAMAAGMPLVVRDSPGARDLVEDGVNGFLFSSAEEGADRLRLLLADRDLRGRMGCNSRWYLRERFSENNYLVLAGLYAGNEEN